MINCHNPYDDPDDCTWKITCQCSANITEDSMGDVIAAWNQRHRSWNLLMEWIDEIYPAHIFDGSSGDIGPQILVKLREIDELRKKYE